MLAIPGIFFASDTQMPSFVGSPLLYLGIACFGLALCAALGEQHFSAVANERQIVIVQEYYTKRSAATEDRPTRERVKWARRAAYFLFAAALAMSAIGFLVL